jgi:hypothetical protein
MSVVYEFKKNSSEKVIASFTTYRGKKLFDLRIFFDASSGDETDWRPSKKGITISQDLIPELKKAIDKASNEWEKTLK